MPRNSSGTFTLAAGNPVVPDTLIETAWANPTLADIAQAVTDSLDRNGRGGMLAPLKFTDGTLAAPAIAFLSESSTGFLRPSTGVLQMAVQGALAMALSSSGVSIAKSLSITENLAVTGTTTLTGATTINGALSLPGGIAALAKLALTGAVAGPVLDTAAPSSGIGAIIRGIPGNNATLILESAGGPSLHINSTHADAGARNWGVFAGLAAHGDFFIKQSLTKGGDPSAGNSVITASPDRVVSIPQPAADVSLVLGGGLRISGQPAALPASMNNGTITYAHPVATCWIGDGTGYSWRFVKRAASVDTNILRILDTGIVAIDGIATNFPLQVTSPSQYVAGFYNSLGGTVNAIITLGSPGSSYLSAGVGGRASTPTTGHLSLYSAKAGALREVVGCLSDGMVSFAPADAGIPNLFVQNGVSHEIMRCMSDSAFITFYANGGIGARRGYLQHTGSIFMLNQEVSGGVIQLYLDSAPRFQIASGGSISISPSNGFITIAENIVSLNTESFVHGGATLPLYGVRWTNNTAPNHGSASGPCGHFSGYGALAFYVGTAECAYIGNDQRFYRTNNPVAGSADTEIATTRWVQDSVPGGVFQNYGTPSRAINTIYTAPGGKALWVCVSATNPGPGGDLVLEVEITAGSGTFLVIDDANNKGSGSGRLTVNGLVPAGKRYKARDITVTASLSFWVEL